jgi:hypothetical protein
MVNNNSLFVIVQHTTDLSASCCTKSVTSKPIKYFQSGAAAGEAADELDRHERLREAALKALHAMLDLYDLHMGGSPDVPSVAKGRSEKVMEYARFLDPMNGLNLYTVSKTSAWDGLVATADGGGFEVTHTVEEVPAGEKYDE